MPLRYDRLYAYCVFCCINYIEIIMLLLLIHERSNMKVAMCIFIITLFFSCSERLVVFMLNILLLQKTIANMGTGQHLQWYAFRDIMTSIVGWGQREVYFSQWLLPFPFSSFISYLCLWASAFLLSLYFTMAGFWHYAGGETIIFWQCKGMDPLGEPLWVLLCLATLMLHLNKPSSAHHVCYIPEN